MALLLLLSGALIISIRILAYLKEEIALEVAKLFPFIALTSFLLEPSSFDIAVVLRKLEEIPLLLENVAYFLVIILSLELVLRVVYTTHELSLGHDELYDDD